MSATVRAAGWQHPARGWLRWTSQLCPRPDRRDRGLRRRCHRRWCGGRPRFRGRSRHDGRDAPRRARRGAACGPAPRSPGSRGPALWYDEKRLVIHPDGGVTDVEDTFPVTSLVAPAGSRAAPITRHVRRPARRRLRVRRTRLAVGVAYAAIAAVLAGGVLMELAKSEDQTPEADLRRRAAAAHPAVGRRPADTRRAGRRRGQPAGASCRASVTSSSSPTPDGFQLRLTTGRAARVTVRAAAVSGDGGAWQWALQTAKATTRTLDVDDLAAGAYR